VKIKIIKFAFSGIAIKVTSIRTPKFVDDRIYANAGYIGVKLNELSAKKKKQLLFMMFVLRNGLEMTK